MIVWDFRCFSLSNSRLHFMEHEYDKLFSWCLCLQLSSLEHRPNQWCFQKTRRRDSFFAWPSWWSNSFPACSPAVVSLGGGWKLKGNDGLSFFQCYLPWKLRNGWCATEILCWCSKRRLIFFDAFKPVFEASFESSLWAFREAHFLEGKPIFRRKFGCWAPKINFPVLHTYLHLEGSTKNSSYLFIWGHLQGFIRG